VTSESDMDLSDLKMFKLPLILGINLKK